MPIISPAGTLFKNATPENYGATSVIDISRVNRGVTWTGAAAGTLTMPTAAPDGSAITVYSDNVGLCTLSPGGGYAFRAQGKQGAASEAFVKLQHGESITLVKKGFIWYQVAGGNVMNYGSAGTLAGKTSELITGIPAAAKLIKFYGKNLSGDILSVRLGHAGGIVSSTSYRNHDGAGVDHLFKWHTASGAHDDCFTLRRLNALTWQGEFSSFDLVPIAILAAASPGYIAMPAPLDRVQLLASGGGFVTGDYELSWE